MAIKDTFNKMISYFDTDGVNEVEEEATDATEEVASRPQQSVRPSSQPQQAPIVSQSQQSQQVRHQAQPQSRPQTQPRPSASERHYQTQARSSQESIERRKIQPFKLLLVVVSNISMLVNLIKQQLP